MIKIQFLTTDSTRPLIDWATAVSLLDIQKKAPGRTVVHSFRGIGGCDEDLHEIEADATKYGISIAGPSMLGANHGLAIVKPFNYGIGRVKDIRQVATFYATKSHLQPLIQAAATRWEKH